jgi:hypothetical protein
MRRAPDDLERLAFVRADAVRPNRSSKRYSADSSPRRLTDALLFSLFGLGGGAIVTVLTDAAPTACLLTGLAVGALGGALFGARILRLLQVLLHLL